MDKQKREKEKEKSAPHVTSKNAILVGLGIVLVIALVAASLAKREAPAGSTADLPAPAPAAPARIPPPAQEQAPVPAQAGGLRVPHYHQTLAEAGPLPRVLRSEQFSIPVVARAYRAAARIPKVLAVQPCYCYCDKLGHGSLLDCFATDHGAG